MGRLYAAGWSPLRGAFWPALLAELVLALGLTILVSQISWMFFEQPLIKLKTRFQYEDRNRLTPPNFTVDKTGC